MSVRTQELIKNMESDKEKAKHNFSMYAVSVIGASDRAADGFPDAESTILQGQNYTHLSKENQSWDEWFDGSGLNSWWD